MRSWLLFSLTFLLCAMTSAAEDGPSPASPLPIEGRLPSLNGSTAWINTPPLTSKGLRGKVVLVQFWTYTCINWRRTAPYLRAWANKYRDLGLVVIGVHTPEFTFERREDLVERNVADLDIDYPVAVDSDFRIWSAFGNHYWPALYFVDSKGRIRHHVFGEGRYDHSERIIQRLLAEAGAAPRDSALVSVDAAGAELEADWEHLRSPETYLGFSRAERFASTERVSPERSRRYSAPTELQVNTWALEGNWTVGREHSASNEPGGRLTYRLLARDLHLVMSPSDPGRPIHFRVLVNGMPPGTARGADIDETGHGKLEQPRMYHLIRQVQTVDPVLFEIEFIDAGAQVFAITFG